MNKKILIGLVALCLVLIGGAAIYLLARKNHFKTKEEVKAVVTLPDSKFLEWEGKEVHYIEAGEGENVLLIHGLGGSVHNFKALFSLLKEDYHVVAVDLPGFGISDAPDMSVYENPNYAKEYTRFFDFFLPEVDLDTFHLIGNSMGGWIAWDMAAANQDRLQSLILLAPAGYDIVNISKKNTGWFQTLPAKIMFAKGFTPDIALLNIKMCYGDETKVDEEDATLIQYHIINREGNFEWMKELGNSGQLADTARIATIQTPTLLIWGTEDKIIPVEHAAYFERDLPNVELKIYEGCGHVPQMERTDVLYNDIITFYEKVKQ